MADVTGPIRTLPGSRHTLPEGAMCDDHPDVPAVARVQGETDSFGSEMLDLCQACVDEMRQGMDSSEARSGSCDWCRCHATDLRDRRDYEEGMSGRIYRVCGDCVRKENAEVQAELDAYDNGGGYDYED